MMNKEQEAAWLAFEYARDLLAAVQLTLDAAEWDAGNLHTLGFAPGSKTAGRARQAFDLIQQRSSELLPLAEWIESEEEEAFDELMGWTRTVPMRLESYELQTAAREAAEWVRSVLIESQAHGDRLENWISETVKDARCVHALTKAVSQFGKLDTIADRLIHQATTPPPAVSTPRLFTLEAVDAMAAYQPAGCIEAPQDDAPQSVTELEGEPELQAPETGGKVWRQSLLDTLKLKGQALVLAEAMNKSGGRVEFADFAEAMGRKEINDDQANSLIKRFNKKLEEHHFPQRICRHRSGFEVKGKETQKRPAPAS